MNLEHLLALAALVCLLPASSALMPVCKQIIPEELLEVLAGPGASTTAVLDFRDTYWRELYGSIPGSLLVDLEDPINFGGNLNRVKLDQKVSKVVVALNEDDSTNCQEVVNSIAESQGFPRDGPQVLAGSVKGWRKSGGDVIYPRLIAFEALRDTLKENLSIVIDVRNRSELNEDGQIPGTYCIPLHEIQNGAFKEDVLSEEEFFNRYGLPKMAKDEPFVLTCRTGRRVLAAEKVLQGLGYTGVRIYLGSFVDWVAKGGQVVRGGFDLEYDLL